MKKEKEGISPSEIRVGSIMRTDRSYWVAVGKEWTGVDITMEDVLDGNILSRHGWVWRRSSLPVPPKIDETMNGEFFYTCFVEGTNGGRHYHHGNPLLAKEEAERLATLPGNHGKKVFVMKAVAYCESTKPEVKWNG